MERIAERSQTDLKRIYQATDDTGRKSLADFEAEWAKVPSIAPAGGDGAWQKYSRFFRLPTSRRKIIYTTNAIESPERVTENHQNAAR